MNAPTRARSWRRWMGPTAAALCAIGLIVWLWTGIQTRVNSPLYGTWLWTGSDWKQLAKSNEDLGTTLFGGELLTYWTDIGGLVDSDGTRWDGTEWVTNSIALPYPLTSKARDRGDAVPSQGAVILDEAGNQLLSVDPSVTQIDAWTHGGWGIVVPPSRYPSAKYVYGYAYDPVAGAVILVMCCDPTNDAGMETWQLRDNKFSELGQIPDSVPGLAIAPDGAGQLIAFASPGAFVLSGGTWSQLSPNAISPPGSQFALVYNRSLGQLTEIGVDMSVHIWQPATLQWKLVTTTNRPPGGCGVSNPVYDPELSGIVLTSVKATCASIGLP